MKSEMYAAVYSLQFYNSMAVILTYTVSTIFVVILVKIPVMHNMQSIAWYCCTVLLHNFLLKNATIMLYDL